MYNTDQAGNAETLKNGLEQKLKAMAVYMGQGDSLEAVVDLAIYGLFAMGKVHQKTGKEQIILQLAAGHLRNIFAALPETDTLKESEKNYRKLEGLIFGKWFKLQQ